MANDPKDPKDVGPPPIRGRGAKGSKGDTGDVGEKGKTGAPGHVGETGETGDTGDTGGEGKRGVKGAQGNQGNRGLQGRSGNNFEVIAALKSLDTKVTHLDKTLDAERDARGEEKKARDNQAKWFKRLLGAAAFFIIVCLVAATASYFTAKSLKKETRESAQRDQAGLAGVCGITNVNRITNSNMLSAINSEKPFVLTPAWPAFLAKWQAEWTPVECRAVVDPEVGVQLCLEYPPSLDPKTGKPIPTTIDPLNKKNCPDTEPPPVTTTTILK